MGKTERVVKPDETQPVCMETAVHTVCRWRLNGLGEMEMRELFRQQFPKLSERLWRQLMDESAEAIKRFHTNDRATMKSVVVHRANEIFRRGFENEDYKLALDANAQVSKLLGLNEETERAAVQINLIAGDDDL